MLKRLKLPTLQRLLADRLACDFHGLGLTVQSDDRGILEMVYPRLRRFLPLDRQPPDLAVQFLSVAAGQDHGITRPPTATKPVYDSRNGSVVYSPDQDQLYVDYADRVRMLCAPKEGVALISFRSAESANLWLASHAAFTMALLELLKRRGKYCLHAAALCLHGRALLLAGSSGAGKSTLALALLRAGFGFMGDDMCFLTSRSDGLWVEAFPDEVDLTENTFRLFPELHRTSRKEHPLEVRKYPFLPEEVYEVRFEVACRPGLVVLPRVANAPCSSLIPMDKSEALVALAPNVLLTEPASSQSHLDALSDLVGESPCYRLEAGRDLDHLPSMLSEEIAALR